MEPGFLLALPPLGVLAVTLLNIVTWPRRARVSNSRLHTRQRVSVCIPARNEAKNIDACLAAVSREPDADEVWVCDDDSTDGTRDIVRRWMKRDARIHLVEGQGPPPGWLGKTHACHQLAQRATGDVLVFVDADTRLQRGALLRLRAFFERYRADVVTAVPRQEMHSLVEKLVIPLLHITYLSWLWLPLVHLSKDARFLAANGQLMAVRRAHYARIGGFARVRDDIVDDMALARLSKNRGGKVVFADGHQLATCRMYDSGVDVWRGFSKNIYAGMGESALMLAVVVAVYSLTFVAPYLLLAVGGLAQTGVLSEVPSALSTSIWVGGVCGVAALTLQRALCVVRYHHPLMSVFTVPLATLIGCAIAINSMLWTRRGTVVWKGRRHVGSTS